MTKKKKNRVFFEIQSKQLILLDHLKGSVMSLQRCRDFDQVLIVCSVQNDIRILQAIKSWFHVWASSLASV